MLGIVANWNVVKVNAAIEVFARESGRDLGEVIRDQSKLLARDLMKLTPPFASFSGKESFAEQRRVGMRRVQIDIRAAFRPLATHPLAEADDPSIAKEFKKLIRKEDWHGLEQLSARTNTPTISASRVIAEPTSAQHNQLRGSRGRVEKSVFKNPIWVKSLPALKRFVKRKQKHVGKTKGGWAPGATAAGASVPGFIARNSSGSYRDMTRATKDPSFELRNPVLWGPELDRKGRFVRESLSRREQALVRQIQAKMDGRWRSSARKAA